jgi:hypothetical protein
MSHTVPQQHPSVVLRSRYTFGRTLLIAAVGVVFCLAIAFGVMAIDDDSSTTSAATPTGTATQSAGLAGHPEEGLAGQPQEGLAGHPDEGHAGH